MGGKNALMWVILWFLAMENDVFFQKRSSLRFFFHLADWLAQKPNLSIKRNIFAYFTGLLGRSSLLTSPLNFQLANNFSNGGKRPGLGGRWVAGLSPAPTVRCHPQASRRHSEYDSGSAPDDLIGFRYRNAELTCQNVKFSSSLYNRSRTRTDNFTVLQRIR